MGAEDGRDGAREVAEAVLSILRGLVYGTVLVLGIAYLLGILTAVCWPWVMKRIDTTQRRLDQVVEQDRGRIGGIRMN